MNRFRTKKKGKEGSDGRTSTEPEQIPIVKHSKTFRRGKKNQEPEPEPELDLSSALPSTDDFRTSLLMTGLSARFSMLREQDDPNSKIGKASDDSVLFPKRQSRLIDYGYGTYGLSDIAEVSSINGSIRPPFAFSKTDSYHGDSDTDSITGSMMSRAKPGEGNVLFGGRQKISMGNRTLYDNDVSQSAFQKLREREREQKEQERLSQEELNDTSLRPNSPVMSEYDQKRQTSSTTSSAGPSLTRTSTAATSFTSQRTPSLSGAQPQIIANMPGSNGLERSATKTRRLYENGLDNHLHEQQNSAMSRIDSLSRQRTMGTHTPPSGISPTFANHPVERWDRQQILGKKSMPNLRAASPTDPPIGMFDFGIKPSNDMDSKVYGMASPPLSPPMTEYDEQQVVLPVQPSDHGKATALGAFTKPTPYDDNRYSQRQIQMQQGRDTPSQPRKISPLQGFVPRTQVQPPTNRFRAESNSTLSSNAPKINTALQPRFMAPQRVEPPKETVNVSRLRPIAPGTFVISPDRSSIVVADDTAQEQKPKPQPKPLDIHSLYRPEQRLNIERPPESQHPSNRPRPFSSTLIPVITNPSLQPLHEDAVIQPNDSPTLGPTAGLSGMVRQHLRSDSNGSSTYGGDGSAHGGSPSRFPGHSASSPQNTYSAKTNPWEGEDWDRSYYVDNSQDDASSTGPRASAEPLPLSAVSPNIVKPAQKPAWERELESHHTRDGSSETAKERMDFKQELAERRRRVQENLKSFVETERSASPVPGAEWKDGFPARSNPLGLLKTKTSLQSLVQKEPGQSKAMKMLGMGMVPPATKAPSPVRPSLDENPWKQEEEEMLRGVGKPTTPPETRAFRQARRDAQRDRERQMAMRYQQKMNPQVGETEFQNQPRRENLPRPSLEQQRQDQRSQEERNDRGPSNSRAGPRSPSRDRKPPPVSYIQRTGSQESSAAGSRPESRVSRDRSESDTSGPRSMSRSGRYKDVEPEATGRGNLSSAQGHYDDLGVPLQRPMARSPGISSFQQSPINSPVMSQAARSRSNSRSTPTNGYFDPHRMQNLQTGVDSYEVGAPPRPSPTAPFVMNATPALVQESPAGSRANTPTMGTTSAFMPPRKRSINKAEISEPRFVSSTSRMTTVNLPPGASLRNGVDESAPPIPPRRRQTRTMFGMGRKEELESMHSLPAASQSTDEMSTFSGDESNDKPRSRLRKSSSAGGNLNAAARQAAAALPSPAMPGAFPSPSPPTNDGSMF